jgi:pimeloyl-ACP methyl ester carboxylesterase
MECKLKDITVYYESFGEGTPILMLHGWSLDHHHMVTDMEPIFEQRQGWQRIYPDLPGHGRTPAKDWIANQDRMLEVVLDFIDHILPGQRFVVAGASAGAYLARGVAYHRSAQMDGLLLTVPLIVADDAQRTVPPHVVVAEDPAFVSGLEPGKAEQLALAVVRNREVLHGIQSSFAPPDQPGNPAFLAQIRENPENYAFSFDVDAIPEPFPAPALIVAGRQDSLVGYRDAWGIVENYPRGTFVVLDRAGHLLEVEQQKLFHALASEWLDRVHEYATAATR